MESMDRPIPRARSLPMIRTHSSTDWATFFGAVRPAPMSWTSSSRSGCLPTADQPVLDVEVVTKGYLSEIFVSFQGEGLYTGRRQLFLRLSGCHMRCRYCDTPGSLERSSHFQVYASNGEC